MKLRAVLSLAVAVIIAALAPAQQKPQMAEEVFKNIQALKGIPVDEFMSTMGVFSAALGMSCEDCHAANDSKWENYALDTSPRKLMARRMVTMMNTINRTNFGGRQMVTCWSCHRGSDRPKTTPNLDTLYNASSDPDEVIPPARNAPPVDQILDKYLRALGGVQKLNALTSFVAKGTSAGYGPESAKRAVEIYAKAPAQRTTIIHTENGDNTSVFDGKAGWIAAPLRPVSVLALAGSALDSARIEAELTFPARIKQSLGQWRVGFPATINERDVQVVQGTGAGGALVTLYFDDESGLLVRSIRYAGSVVGRAPTQTDYSDYREVAGVKLPFKWTMAWLDGKENVELTEVRGNVAVEGARFGRPSR